SHDGPPRRSLKVPVIQSDPVAPTSALEGGVARDFRMLAVRIRAAGLLDRRLRYYTVKLVLTGAAFAAGWVAFFILGASWANLGVAVFLGVMRSEEHTSNSS